MRWVRLCQYVLLHNSCVWYNWEGITPALNVLWWTVLRSYKKVSDGRKSYCIIWPSMIPRWRRNQHHFLIQDQRMVRGKYEIWPPDAKVVDQVCKCLDGTEGQQTPGLITIIFYVEEILHLFQNIINVIFMVEMCDVTIPGTQHDQMAHEVIFGSQSCPLVNERV